MRPPAPDEAQRVYRRVPYRPLLDVFVLDMRSYRGPNDKQKIPVLGKDTAMLGAAQSAWLKRELMNSRATWKVIAADLPSGVDADSGAVVGSNVLSPMVGCAATDTWVAPVEVALGDARLVLEREPLNTQAMSNLILVLSDTGRRDEAQRYANQLAQIQPVAPYKFFDEGVAAMRAGDYAQARQLFRKEVARAAYVPEFHFWLGLASYGLGDVVSARGEIERIQKMGSNTNTISNDSTVYTFGLGYKF